MKITVIIVRTLLGLAFTVFGLNIFLNFIPPPPMQLPELAIKFNDALGGSGYLKVVGVFQIVGGLLLLIGRFVPVGLVLLGPVLVNILLFHTLLMKAGLPIPLVFTALWLVVFVGYRDAFAGIFRQK